MSYKQEVKWYRKHPRGHRVQVGFDASSPRSEKEEADAAIANAPYYQCKVCGHYRGFCTCPSEKEEVKEVTNATH